MILGWAQTQPSGRVVTHLHWVPGSLPRMCAPCRLGRRPPLLPTYATAAVAAAAARVAAARRWSQATTRSTTRLLRGYYEATTRSTTGLLSYLI